MQAIIDTQIRRLNGRFFCARFEIGFAFHSFVLVRYFLGGVVFGGFLTFLKLALIGFGLGLLWVCFFCGFGGVNCCKSLGCKGLW